MRVFYDANAIFVDAVRLPIPAGTLMATSSGTVVTIQSIHAAAPIVSADYTLIEQQDGTILDNVADCVAYLNAQFTMRRSLDVPSVTAVAAVDLVAGTPVAVSRQNGQLQPARADTFVLSFVAGLASQAIAAGFAVDVTRNPVTLADWTSLSGSADLSTGLPYFLAPAGGLTLTPTLLPGNCCVRVGEASSPRTLVFKLSDPILL